MTTLASSEDRGWVRVEPDLDFIGALRRQGGDCLKKCFQCGTCSATCDLSPDPEPFPRKEMAWAAWGMKDRLLADPDIWLCHQCNDCSTRCPRGVRPGDVLGAVRQECVQHYAVPHFFGRWVNQPYCIPLLLGIATTLLALALVVGKLMPSRPAGERIVYAYSSVFPHWLLNTFFGLLSLLVLLAIGTGVMRFWRAMHGAAARAGTTTPVRGLWPSILVTLKNIFVHKDFASCTAASRRTISHLCVFFGFLALTLVTLMVITARFNPLLQGDFVYPFGFWSPWKILANVGGLAVAAGCLLMMRDRLLESERFGAGSYFDWALLATLLLVVLTGFIAEALHYLRLEPHRHLVYFVHLVFVFALLAYLPYSKLAHVAYRGTAMVFAEQFGRAGGGPACQADGGSAGQQRETDDVDDTNEAAR